MTTRNLTFKSSNLGDNVTLMLCFTPPSPRLFVDQFPIAWKVTTLAAKGRSVMNATWTSQLAFSAAQVGSGSLVTAGNYTPIDVGETTTLQLDSTVHPPVYHWTDPKPIGGKVKTIRAVNGTGGPTGIGIGFITDIDTEEEDMSIALAWPNVGNTTAVSGDFTPVLSAYVMLDYQETEIIRGDVQSVSPIWQANLVSLGADTTIVVSKASDGSYQANQLNASMGDDIEDVDGGVEMDIAPSVDLVRFPTRVYCATLAFTDVIGAHGSIKALTQHLVHKGYRVDVTFKPKGTTAHIELQLPPNTSCSQAEKEMLGFIETYGFNPPRIAIKARDAERMVYSAGRASFWLDINPASQDWFNSGKVAPFNGLGPQKRDSGHVLVADIINAVSEMAVGNGEATGNGTANGSAGTEVAPPAPVNYGKTRTGTVGRKASMMSVASTA